MFQILSRMYNRKINHFLLGLLPTFIAGKTFTLSLRDDRVNDRPRLIGISGKMGVGKSSLAMHLVNESKSRNLSYQKKSFADKLYCMISILINRPVQELKSNHFKSNPVEEMNGVVTGRQLLQQIGTNVIRKIHPDIWIDLLFMDYNADQNGWIIDDVRFLNELSCIKDMGGYLVYLETNNSVNEEEKNGEQNHISELITVDDQKFDYILMNSRQTDDVVVDDQLKEMANALLNQIYGDPQKTTFIAKYYPHLK